MKISECSNAPEWLKQAETENEDIEVLAWGWVIWKSGTWNGGNFLGGNFRGGDFRGGNFLGGDFRGGDFRGGDFLGGNFRGGNFRGGDFRGGNFLGGDFRGGNFLGIPCNWAMSIGHAEGYTKVLVGSIAGVAYIYAGCRWFTLSEARKHWDAKKSDRPLTCALLIAATEIAKIKGLKESESA